MFRGVYNRKFEDLNGIWKYRLDQNDMGYRQSWYLEKEASAPGWKEIKVPHNWYLEEEIGDYFGTIWYTRTFTVPEYMQNDRLFLYFEGVDYITDVWVNGEYLGQNEGIFNSFEFEITHLVDINKENTIIVRDSAPKDLTEYVEADHDETPMSEKYKFHQSIGITQIKGHMIEAMHRPGSMTSFRQDGNSGGIWGDVKLIGRPAVHIQYVKSFTKIGYKKDWLGDKQDKPDGTGLAAFDVFINNGTGRAVRTEIKLSVTAYNFEDDTVSNISREVVLQPGDNVCKITVTIPQVKLWWTWDHGFPHLYTAALSADGDRIEMNFGVKEITTDEAGQWYLNGKHIFLRGMRYISSLWMSEANEAMWEADFRKMLDMDINAIRIGSHVERDGLYTMCDEMGLLMWQVFPLHYCISDSDDVINRASDMIRDMGMMLTNHACMGMWSVYKEPEIYQLPDKPNNYFRLCQVLKETLKTVDPVRWVHLGDYREGVMNIMIGCCSDGDTDVDDLIIPPNIVEFGSQSIPCLETLRTFIPEDKLWPPHWDTWEYWGLFYSNTFEYAKVELGNSLEEFIENTQEYEAVSVKEQIEFLRMKKYDPVSSMYLYYWSDACPMIGSGLLDYYRRPYKVYDYMQKVYTPVLVCAQPCIHPYKLGREKIFHVGMSYTARVWAINDNYESIPDVLLQWKVTDCETDEILCRNSFRLELLADSAEIPDHIVLPLGEELSGHRCRVDMKISSGNEVLSENDSYFRVEP